MSSIGSVKQKIAPVSSPLPPIVATRFSAQIWPPCASTMPLQMVRPSPVPHFSLAAAARWNLPKMRVSSPWTDKGKQPFYLMENKVSNDVYGVFAEANPSAINGSRWRLGARAKPSQIAELYPMLALFAGPPWHANYAAARVLTDGRANAFLQEDWPSPDDFAENVIKHPRWPVLRVDIQEAHLCADWLGGVLPSVEEWDKAAGRFEEKHGEGPYEMPFEPGEIAIDRGDLGPLPVGSAAKDICRYSGCRDMAGNGLEWTRSLRVEGDPSMYFGDVKKVSLLATTSLRGRDYHLPTPLTYAHLEDRPLHLPFFQSQRIVGNDSLIGFRVAITP